MVADLSAGLAYYVLHLRKRLRKGQRAGLEGPALWKGQLCWLGQPCFGTHQR